MSFIDNFKNDLFKINEETFAEYALALFDFQYHQNIIYKFFCDSIGKTPKSVKSIDSIPFLPIEFYKNHTITSSSNHTQKIFMSSGTTSSNRSKHHLKDIGFYHAVSLHIFQNFFGNIAQFQLLALLPSYLEQGDSSLISMIDHFLKYSAAGSGYFLGREISALLQNNQKKIIFGVTYALLDLPQIDSQHLVVIETGGMKGRKKEITRAELHQQLNEQLNIEELWSEYGMTELISQAYAKNGEFKFPKWATVKIREINDPFSYVEDGKSGGINIIDLANIESCAFIETKDIGIMQKNESFQVLGRFDNSDIRGCSLLI